VSGESLRERLGALLDAGGQMFWELDRSFRVAYANDFFKRALGDPVGRICYEFMAYGESVCTGCPVQRVFDGEERAVAERLRMDLEGREIWLRDTACPIKDEAGQVIGASELTIDITDRKLMEEEIRESERRYRSLVEQVPDIIFSLDSEGRFLFVNARMEPLLGYPVSRILETSLKDYVLPEDLTLVEGMLKLGPDEIWDEEIGMLDAKGGQKFAKIRCKASYDRDGSVAGFEGVMRDRSSRRKLEEELRGSREALVQKIKIIDELYEHILHTGKYKAIEEHTAEVAHELRQPLAIVGGFARRMAKQLNSAGKIDPETQLQYVEIIVTEVERLERILESLIDFTRRGAVHLQTIDPNLLIEYVLGVTEGQRKQKNIRLEARLGSEVGEVLLDPGRFQQLVLNLVLYAVETSPKGAVIELETGASIPSDKAVKSGELQSESYFEVKMRVRSATIPAEELHQLFSPFSQSRGRLTGPGLAIARKIADDHSGSISVRSNGGGTVFTVWLPLYQPRLARSQSPLTKGARPDSPAVPV